MPRRLALLALLLAALAPSALRPVLRRAVPPRACAPDGRGEPPRGWIGCAADPGLRRALGGRERLLSGLPLDPNTASPEELAEVPGLSPRLAAEIVAERGRGGPFGDVADLRRVRGIGPARLRRAGQNLAVER